MSNAVCSIGRSEQASCGVGSLTCKLYSCVIWAFEIFTCSKFKFCRLSMFTIIMVSHITSTLCCNPFNESGPNNIRNNLINILLWMKEKYPQLNSDHKVCDKCHKKISQLKCDASNKNMMTAIRLNSLPRTLQCNP
jgi:hypothetical protein